MKKKNNKYVKQREYYEFEEDAAYLAEDEELAFDEEPVSMETLEFEHIGYDEETDTYYAEEEEAADVYEEYEADGERYADDEEVYESEDVLYADEEDAYEPEDALYADEEDAYGSEDALYADEEEVYESEDVLYADEEEEYDLEEVQDGFYAAEAYEDDVYEEDGYYAQDSSYDDEEEDDYYESEEYEDEYDGEYEEDARRAAAKAADRKVKKSRKRKSQDNKIAAFFGTILEKVTDMTAMDRIVAATGAIVLCVAMVTCSVYASAKAVDAQVEAFSEIGGQLESIGVAGGSGLLAMADAQNAVADTDLEELFANEEDRMEVDANEGQQVVMNMTSVEKDLKIKFVNKATGKLISGISFEISATDPGGSTSTWTDDDRDGVIYKKDLSSGGWKIALKASDALADYKYDTNALSVTVKDKIEYKKIDVTDEVKTEAEVNAAVEDTQVKTEVESTLKDTVEWVESTKTPINGGTESGFVEIDKKKIPDPATIARAATNFLRLTETLPTEEPSSEEKPSEGGSTEEGPSEGGSSEGGSSEGGSTPEESKKLSSVSVSGSELKVGATKKLEAKVSFSGSGSEPSVSYEWNSDQTSVATVASDGTVTAKAAGSATITVKATAGGDTKSATCTITVTEEKDTKVDHIQIDGSTIALEIGGTATLSVKAYNAKNEEVSGSFSWSSNKEDIVTVDGNGKVTGIKAGEASITAREAGGKTASITVKVNAGLGVALDKSELSLRIAESTSLTASVTGTDKKAEWSSSDTAIATVSAASDGKSATIKGIKAGEATITVTVKDSSNKEQKATCKVKVAAENTELKVSLDKTSSTVFTGNTITLKVTATSAAEIKAEGYAWSTDNDKIASIKVAGDKKSVEVTGVKKGDAKITIKVTDSKGNTASAECKVTVKLNPKDDGETTLKDKDGNSVYILNDKGEYVKATYKDYYTAKKFYIKTESTEYKYTGWQTIDGKTYYFDKNGKKVTGDQVIKGAAYSFDSEGVLRSSNGVMGIDVSKWNGSIDWKAVKNSGVSYVIIRCGYRGSSTGAMVVDPKFKANIQGATNAGLKVGIYFFSQAVNEREAVEEASMTLSLIKGYKISYPVFIDIEGSGGRGDKIDKGTRTAVANAFCKTIQNGGYTAGIYANKNWFETKMNTSSLTGYKLWLAQYATTPTYKATRYDMWQYTSKGSIAGISGNVDLNLSYLGY